VTAFLDLADPDFSATGEEVRRAREQDWWACTNYGIAVLRYAEVRALLADRRFVQGSAKWPALNGVERGPFVDWWSRTVLNLEGEEHHRLRRLLTPAFAPRHVTPLVPRFAALAEELIDAFAPDGRCEFMSQFAGPYASRVATIVLGLPDEEGRLAMLRLHTRRMPTVAVDLEKLARDTEGLSPADLKALAQEAALAAMSRTRADGETGPGVTQADFEEALSRLRTGSQAQTASF